MEKNEINKKIHHTVEADLHRRPSLTQIQTVSGAASLQALVNAMRNLSPTHPLSLLMPLRERTKRNYL